MATKNLGRIGFVDKGNWSATETYNKLDVVQVKDYGSFYSKKDGNKNSNPVTDSVNWAPVASGDYAKAQGDYAKEQGDAVKPFATYMADINRDMGKYQQLPDVTLTLVESGKRIDKDGNFVSDSSFNIGRLGAVSKGNIYELLMGGSDKMVLGTALFVSHTVEKIGGVDKDVYKPIYSAVTADLPISTYAVLLAGEDYADVLVSYRNDVAGANTMKVARWGIFASIATQLANLRGDVDLKSFSDGYYDNMGVGFAKNLIGDGEATPEEFTERVAGGSHQIDDSLAEYVTIKGNSVVWNQLLRPFSNDNWKIYDSSKGSYYQDEGVATLNYTASGAGYSFGLYYTLYAFDTSKYYLVTAEIMPSLNCSIGIELGNSSTLTQPAEANVWNKCYFILKAVIDGPVFLLKPATNVSDGDSIKFKNVKCTDLTQMFGAGNEPTTFEEWNARKPKVADDFAYNKGTIVNMTAEGVKTTGRNLWDEEWENGKYFQPSTGIIVNEGSWKMSSLIKAFGNKKYYIHNTNTSQVIVGCWDRNLNYLGYAAWSNGNVTFTTKPDTYYIRFEVIGNILESCISISDPSFNGQYEPHITSERKWTETMKKCFPDGMAKAGNVYDEFGATKAVKRIGVKVFDGTENWEMAVSTIYAISLNSFNAAKMAKRLCLQYANTKSPTDGNGVYVSEINMVFVDSAYTTLESWKSHLVSLKAAGTPLTVYYEFAEPIVTTYDELNLTSRVWRNGTEEIIVPEGKESSPISADVIYQINAFKTIKANKQGIEDLNAKPAISLTADEVAKLRALINTNTQNLEE